MLLYYTNQLNNIKYGIYLFYFYFEQIKIEVIDPVLKDKSHVVYTLRGRDSNGEIEI